jgi:aromatic-L-amino-acid decarboxylase
MIDDFVEQHRFLGPAVARIVVDHVAGLSSRRVTPEATPAELEKLFDEPLPENGIALEEILTRFRKDVAPNAMGVPSPRYFGQFNPTATADWRLGRRAFFDAQSKRRRVAQWSRRPAMIEARVIRWLCDLLEYGPKSFGTLASGGSEGESNRVEVCAR